MRTPKVSAELAGLGALDDASLGALKRRVWEFAAPAPNPLAACLPEPWAELLAGKEVNFFNPRTRLKGNSENTLITTKLRRKKEERREGEKM